MKILNALLSSSVLLSLGAYGCSDDDPANNDTGGGKGGGGAPQAGSAGSSQSKAGAGAGGRNSAAGQPGAAGDEPTDGGTGGAAEGGSSAGGSLSAGGSAGTGGDAGMDSGGEGGSGDSGAGGQTELGRLADLPGPSETDQAVALVDRAYLVEADASVEHVLTDDNGNLVIVTTHAGGPSVAKYGPDLSFVWTKSLAPSSVTVQAVALGDGGEIFLGGSTAVALPGETQNALTDAVVGKLDADGEPVWMHQWGSSSHEASAVIAAGPDGSVIAAGPCSGQVPGNPADNAGRPFLVRYEADGTRTWLLQHPVVATDHLLVDANGNAYVGGGSELARFDASGELVRTTRLISDPYLTVGDLQIAPPYYNNSSVSFGAAGEGFYYLSNLWGFSPFFARLDADGSILWYRIGGTRSAVIDAVENVIWTGAFAQSSFTGVIVTNDSVYITGSYQNAYQNGSVPRPPTSPAFVGRYDLEGNQVWFQELMLDRAPLTGAANAPVSLGGLVTDPDGNLVIVANGVGPVETTPGNYTMRNAWYAFKLSKSDGTLL